MTAWRRDPLAHQESRDPQWRRWFTAVAEGNASIPSETHPRPDLQDARLARAVDDAEVGCGAGVRSGLAEIGVVEEVEELAAQQQPEALPHRERLLEGGVDVEGSHAAQEIARGVAIRAE